ncbi:glycosyltransferase [Thalassospira sp. SN3W]|uniref:glycosyltransferase n=1 Tax=Thalassospira sp. SN3W TaxID=3035476 RepID=UPI00311ADB93
MAHKTLHITHTDIRTDSRILKEMGALAAHGYEVNGIGVVHEEGAKESEINFATTIKSVKLFTRHLTLIPRTLRHALSICELTVKTLPEVLRQKPDVVHCHDTLALPLGVIAKLFHKTKVIYDAHELESNRNGITKFQGLLTSCAEKLLWKYIDALIVVSPSIANWYNTNIGFKKTEIILNSPLFEKNETGNSDYLRTNFNIPSQQKVFIYIGILGHGRGIELITEAFTQTGVTSHVVFLGYGELADKLHQVSKEYKNVHIHSAVPHSKVVEIAKSSDFGLCLIENVSLSDYYCLPNKLFEYCFSDIPVLASNFPDIKEVISRYNIGETCSLNVNSIKEAIIRLESSTGSPKFSNLDALSWQAQEQKLISLYRNILEK